MLVQFEQMKFSQRFRSWHLPSYTINHIDNSGGKHDNNGYKHNLAQSLSISTISSCSNTNSEISFLPLIVFDYEVEQNTDY